ncbi:MAG: PAS domain S-box protein, partial [Pedobacter sp.]
MTTLYSEQDRFNSLVEASPMPTAIYKGQNMIVSSANRAMLDLWGKNEDAIGKPLIEAVPELENQPFLGILKEVFETGKTYYSKESPADLVVDGKLQTFYFTFTYKALKTDQGKIFAIINTAAHLTELVAARKQIAETQERLTFALISADIGTWDLDPIHNSVNWDARCRELFGFAKDGEVKYEDVLSCIHQADEPLVHQAVLKALDTKELSHYDIKYRTLSKADGKLRWVHCKGKAYFNDQGIAYRFAGIAQDITNEIAGNQREQQLLTLINNNADHMTVADLQGNVIYMNKASRLMLGVDLFADVTKLSAKDFYEPEELERVQNHIIKEIDPVKGWHGNISLQNFKTKENIPCRV